MRSRFDPSAFIAAEAVNRESQAVADGSSGCDLALVTPKTTENRPLRGPSAPLVAEVATIAAVAPETVTSWRHEAVQDDLPWSGGLARLETMTCPDRVRPDVWDELVNEAHVVSRRWGRQALGFGWSPLDLFGCNPDPYARRVDRDGLVACIVGFSTPMKLTELTAPWAVLADMNGVTMRWRPGNRQGQAFLWDAYSMASGP